MTDEDEDDDDDDAKDTRSARAPSRDKSSRRDARASEKPRLSRVFRSLA